MASLAARGEALDWLAFVYAFQGAVNPAEAKRNFHGILVANDARAVCRRPVYTQPEFGNPVVILPVPAVKFLAAVYVQ